jgi:hypothetical protein
MSEIDHENLSKNFSSNADANEIDLADAVIKHLKYI